VIGMCTGMHRAHKARAKREWGGIERTLLVMVLIGGRLYKVVKGTVMDTRPLRRPTLWIRKRGTGSAPNSSYAMLSIFSFLFYFLFNERTSG
jgi:hypothetical protein